MIKENSSKLLKLFLIVFILFGSFSNIFSTETTLLEIKHDNTQTNTIMPSSKPTTATNTYYYAIKTDDTYKAIQTDTQNYCNGKTFCLQVSSGNEAKAYATLQVTSKTDYNTKVSKYKTDANSLTSTQIQALQNNGENSNDWKEVYTSLKTNTEAVTTAQKAYDECSATNSCNTNGEKDALAKAKITLKETEAKTNLDPNPISSILELDQATRDLIITNYNNKQCGSGWTSSICQLLSSKSEQQYLVENYNSKVQALQNVQQKKLTEAQNLLAKCKENCEDTKKELENTKKRLMDEYNKEVAELLTNSIKDKNAKNKCVNTITTDCLDAIKSITCEATDANCEQNKKDLLAIADAGYKQTQVQTNLAYDIVSAILNPDRNAISAAKVFGFEANYNNVPSFLKETIPSSICLAKIDGYLDKTVESTLNGQGGVTNYGCAQEYIQEYNEQTKKYQTVPSTKCLEVLSDLRAQRTQVTPDNKTLISYSYYIKSPPETPLKYIIAISYKEGSTIKKKEIITLTEINGTKNGFDSAELQLDGNIENIDEDSFTIYLLAVYSSNNNVYQKLSYPIPPISYGDMYSAPISNTVSSTNENSAETSVNDEHTTTNELSTNDLLSMI